jgi:hypothetical protein
MLATQGPLRRDATTRRKRASRLRAVYAMRRRTMLEMITSGVPEEAVTDSPATPTTTHYQEVAAQFIALLNAAIALIPSLEPFHASTEEFVRAHQSFPIEFIATVLAAVELDPELRRVDKFDVAEARDTLQFLDAFRPVIDQLATLLRDLKFTCGARKARVVADGLLMYGVAKAFGRDPASAAVAAHARNMKRDLKRSGARRTRPAG